MSPAAGRTPRSQAYAKLGAELARIREAANMKTREVLRPDGSFYASGHISNVERGHTPPSEDLIKAYARMGGDYMRLLALLEEARRSMRRRHQAATEADDDIARQLLDPRTDPYVLRCGYTVEVSEDTIFVGDNRAVVRNVYRTSLRTEYPTTRFFPFRYGYEEDMRPGVATAEAGGGCAVALAHEHSDGSLYVVLELDPEQRDALGRYTFSWTIFVHSEVPMKSRDSAVARSRIQLIARRIQFTPPAVPSKIWWYRGFNELEGGVDPPRERVIQLNNTHFYFHDFTDVEREECGLAWWWKLDGAMYTLHTRRSSCG